MNQLTDEEKDLVLRVAWLIEQGSEDMQQITGRYFSPDFAPENINGCCAMGALIKALGATVEQTYEPKFSLLDLLDIYTWPRLEWPESEFTPFAASPKTNTAPLPDVIIFMNDKLGMDFEHIVSYLRSATAIISMIPPKKRQKR